MIIGYFVFNPIAALREKQAFGTTNVYQNIDSVYAALQATYVGPSDSVWMVPGTFEC